MAWKKTGRIREGTAGRKLMPMMWKAWTPISRTAGSAVKMRSSCSGISSKQAIPTSMKDIAEALTRMDNFLTNLRKKQAREG